MLDRWRAFGNGCQGELECTSGCDEGQWKTVVSRCGCGVVTAAETRRNGAGHPARFQRRFRRHSSGRKVASGAAGAARHGPIVCSVVLNFFESDGCWCLQVGDKDGVEMDAQCHLLASHKTTAMDVGGDQWQREDLDSGLGPSGGDLII